MKETEYSDNEQRSCDTFDPMKHKRTCIKQDTLNIWEHGNLADVVMVMVMVVVKDAGAGGCSGSGGGCGGGDGEM